MPTLEKTVELWLSVREENERDRELVTEIDWATWENVDKEVTNNLTAIIQRSVEGISPADKTELENITSRVKKATRRTGKELQDYARSHGLIEDTRTSKKERERLLALLRR